MELNDLKGISEKRVIDLNKMGIMSVIDLIKTYPRSYLDLRKITPLKNCYHNDFVLTDGVCENIAKNFYSAKRTKYVKILCEQNGEPFTCIWFNQPYVLSKLKTDVEYLFYGRLQNRYGASTLVNPTFEELDQNKKLKGIVPVYSIKGNITQSVLKKAIYEALEKANFISIIPEVLIKKYNLENLNESLRAVHFPKNIEEKNKASDRLALEEYFSLISSFRIIKGSERNERVNIYNFDNQKLKDFIATFPFEFTDGQKKAVNDVISDLKNGFCMNRLLQGDVGSGKTAVSLCGIFCAKESGYQSAMLAPTEVLAKQNFDILKKFFPNSRVEFLAGGLKLSEKKRVKEDLKNGSIDIICGTHSLFSTDVEFKNLGFIVCDEQHRFGVAQRSAIYNKGNTPDVLIMSATPIPRTLSLIFYGDLDISTIPDKPKKRAEIQTNIVSELKRQSMLDYIMKEVKTGKQAYFVCPKIDEDEEGAVLSVTELFDELTHLYPEIKFALLHGKLKEAEKTSIMQSFKNQEIDCLVSTTVIEVGIDVPNATIMVIENAERYGLSQLHQLRGRVGRSTIKSYCFLLTGTSNEKSLERLKILKENSDGFKISEYDFENRGSGDFLGTRQHGKFLNEINNLQYSNSVIFFAKKLCDEAFDENLDIDRIRKIAIDKYNKLKDVILN